MSKNVAITPGVGAAIAADEVTYNAVASKVQIIKLMLGADGAYDTLVDSGQQTMANSLPIVIASDQTTLPVSLASVPSHAVTNAGTFAVQATLADGASTTLGAKADAKNSATDSTAITIMQVLKQISASVQAPPSQAVTNAGTFAVQEADGANTTLGAIADAAVTAGATGSISAKLRSISRDIVSNIVLAAGTNAIGKLAANSGVIIGDVNAVTVPTDPFGANADAASATGSISAKLRFIASTGIPITGTVTVGSHNVTNAGTFVVQENGTQVQVDDAAFTPATSKILMVGFEADETATDSIDEGDGGAARMTLDRKQIVTTLPHTSGGLLKFHLVGAATDNATNVKASAGQVYCITGFNLSASPRYLKFHNTAGTPTAGSGVTDTFLIPGNTSGAGFVINIDKGIAFGTGIGITLVTGIADNNTTAIGASEVVINIYYF